jgi:hypothetical protein
MPTKIKIPRGWRKWRDDEKIIAGDKFLQYSGLFAPVEQSVNSVPATWPTLCPFIRKKSY